jgi:hypothetical protein
MKPKRDQGPIVHAGQIEYHTRAGVDHDVPTLLELPSWSLGLRHRLEDNVELAVIACYISSVVPWLTKWVVFCSVLCFKLTRCNAIGHGVESDATSDCLGHQVSHF